LHKDTTMAVSFAVLIGSRAVLPVIVTIL